MCCSLKTAAQTSEPAAAVCGNQVVHQLKTENGAAAADAEGFTRSHTGDAGDHRPTA